VVNFSRWLGAYVAAGLVTSLLSACDLTTLSGQRPQLPDPFDTVQKTDLDPRYPQEIGQERNLAKPTPSASYYGSESASSQPSPDAPPIQQAPSGDGYELNFENAAVTTVAKVILGDILGVGYTIDPRVQGTLTIASGRPVPKSQLVLVLEDALRMSNVVLVREAGGGYRLIPSGDAQGAGPVGDRPEGYGISVVPLRYTSAQNILKLLDSFAIRPGMARADTSHNLILVEGTGPERANAVDAILSFDVDWMHGQSVGIYPLENAAPEEVIKELGNVMENGNDGLNQGLVTLQPIARLNAVLVVTKKPALLKAAATWIHRLDQANNAGASVHVYRLRYADARQIAKVLGDLFGSGSSGLNSAANQIAPGAGTTSSTSGIFGAQTNGGFPGASGGQPGLPGSTGGGLGGLGGLGGGGGGGGTGLQLGNMGNGFGNPQAVGGAGGGGGGNSNIEAGAFGSRNGQGQGPVVGAGFRIAADVTNNSLVIFASSENYKVIEQTLAQMDRPQLQVAIHATIAEVTLNNDLQFGVEYYLQKGNAQFGFNTLASAAASASGGPVTQTLGAVLPGANLLLGPQASPQIVLNELRTVTDVKVLSSPSLVVLDNQTATLLVGDQVPVETATSNILTGTQATTGGNAVVNSISYINTGVILQVLPRVNSNGNVVLAVEQEVSGVENGAAASLTPTVSQRQIKSSISVASGQTVLLGGLITETQSRTRSGIPVLEELPAGIGNLFSTNDRSTSRTEIIVFIEPQIIRNSVDAAKVAEELRAKLRGSANAAFQPGPSLRGDPSFAQ
jgi:general secretion pathway protein D